MRADLCPERRIKLQSQGVGAHPWIFERRNGLARGGYNRSVADDRVPGEQISAEVQCRLNAPIPAGRYSAYQLVFGSNPADPFGWDDKDEDVISAQDSFGTVCTTVETVCRNSLYNSGNCAGWHGRPPRRR